MFHMTYSIVLLLYSCADKASLQYLDRAWHQLPQPPKPVNMAFRRHYLPEELSRRPEVRGIWLENRSTNDDLDYPAYAPVDHYPVLIAGYKPFVGRTREVSDSDIEKFILEHPGCISVGEFFIGNKQVQNMDEIDAVYMAAIKVIHDLRKAAIRDSPVQLESSKDTNDVKKRNRVASKIKNLFQRFS
jgi:hypothetical protein